MGPRQVVRAAADLEARSRRAAPGDESMGDMRRGRVEARRGTVPTARSPFDRLRAKRPVRWSAPAVGLLAATG